MDPASFSRVPALIGAGMKPRSQATMSFMYVPLNSLFF
jgi:hypothetical protein